MSDAEVSAVKPTATSVLTGRQWAALIALTLMWGINWPMMKISLREMPPLHFRALTMTVGAIWLTAFFAVRGVRMRPRGREWGTLASLALPNILGWHVCAIMGVRELASGRAAILGFTMPIWTVLISVVVLRERLTARVAWALAAVVLAIVLLLMDEWSHLAGRPIGVLWMGAAAWSWAIGTVLIRRTKLALPSEAATVWMMAYALVCLWSLTLWLEPWPDYAHFSRPMWGSLVYGSFINFGFAQIFWFGLARSLPPAVSAMSVMAVPLVGAFSAALLIGEWPRWPDLVALVCVMAAMAAVLRPMAPKPSPTRIEKEVTP